MSQRERKGSLCPAAREALGRPSSGCNSTGPTPSDEGQGPLSEIRADDIVFKVPKCRLCGLVTQVCLTLCKSLDCSLPGSLVHGISQAKYWSGLPFPILGGLPNPETEPESLVSPALAGRFFTTAPPGKPLTYISGKCRVFTLTNKFPEARL